MKRRSFLGSLAGAVAAAGVAVKAQGSGLIAQGSREQAAETLTNMVEAMPPVAPYIVYEGSIQPQRLDDGSLVFAEPVEDLARRRLREAAARWPNFTEAERARFLELEATYEQLEAERRAEEERIAHVKACCDCGRRAGFTPISDVLTMPALLLAPVGTRAFVGSNIIGQIIERVEPFRMGWDGEIQKNVRTRQAARVTCARYLKDGGFMGVSSAQRIERPDGNVLVVDWIPF